MTHERRAARQLMAALQAKNHCPVTGEICRTAHHRCGCFLQFQRTLDKIAAETLKPPGDTP